MSSGGQNHFFNDADFDISANIESALAEISFSAIELPADFSTSQNLFSGSKQSLFKESQFNFDKSFASMNSEKQHNLTQSNMDRTFASSVLDKAVMDNLDLTFTEALQQKDTTKSSRSWSQPNKRSNRVSNDTIIGDEIDKALKDIPRKLDLSLLEQQKKSVAPKPFGILKPTRYQAPPPSDEIPASVERIDSNYLAPLKTRLQAMRKAQDQIRSVSNTDPVDSYMTNVLNLKKLLEEEIRVKRLQKQQIERNTETLEKLLAKLRLNSS